MKQTMANVRKKLIHVISPLLKEDRFEQVSRKVTVLKAEFMMKVAGFIFDNHDTPVLKSASLPCNVADLRKLMVVSKLIFCSGDGFESRPMRMKAL